VKKLELVRKQKDELTNGNSKLLKNMGKLHDMELTKVEKEKPKRMEKLEVLFRNKFQMFLLNI
jgi:hypothetical protein